MAIRRLRADEPIPEGPPRRYVHKTSGYVVLRWKVGAYSYVEVTEHRFVAGRDAPAVHHKNRNRSDNSAANLQPVSHQQHGLEHTSWDLWAARRAYESGWTTTRLADFYGVTPGQISRGLRGVGTPMRPAKRLRLYVDAAKVTALHAAGFGRVRIARQLGVTVPIVSRVFRDTGLHRGPGRVKGMG